MMFFDRDTLPTGAEDMLAPRERRLWRAGSERRRRSFPDSRIALEELTRNLDPAGCPADPRHIDTIADDGIRPRCHDTGRAVAVTHDARWVVAMAGEHPIGVDVEPITEPAFRLMEMFLDDGEQDLVGGCRETAPRMWTFKEAAAKALNVVLPIAWDRVQVEASSPSTSAVRVDGDRGDAWHEVIDGHVFTVLERPERRRNHVVS
jgi:phosphopantetheinyl transferase